MNSCIVGQPLFDVFLTYNTQDESQVIAIAKKLRRRGLNPWIEAEQMPPRSWSEDLIQQVIQETYSAAVFIGPGELVNLQFCKLLVHIHQCLEAGKPPIFVLLPGVDGIPEIITLLKPRDCVRFTSGIDDFKALDELAWGITKQKPRTDFDVLLCYNEEDILEVKKIEELLKEQRIQPWFAPSVAPPGTDWKKLLAKDMEQIKSVAVFIGRNGCPWQQGLLEDFLWEFKEQGCPLIPAILQNVLDEPQLPIYLRRQGKVDFRQKEPDPIKELLWGITRINE